MAAKTKYDAKLLKWNEFSALIKWLTKRTKKLSKEGLHESCSFDDWRVTSTSRVPNFAPKPVRNLGVVVKVLERGLTFVTRDMLTQNSWKKNLEQFT